MRGLEFQDTFSMARILSKLDIADEIKELSEKVNATKKDADGNLVVPNIERVGIEFILTLIGKASTREMEQEIYSFLADVLEVEVNELRHMKPGKLIELLKGADAEEWKDFFMSAVRFLQSR